MRDEDLLRILARPFRGMILKAEARAQKRDALCSELKRADIRINNYVRLPLLNARRLRPLYRLLKPMSDTSDTYGIEFMSTNTHAGTGLHVEAKRCFDGRWRFKILGPKLSVRKCFYIASFAEAMEVIKDRARMPLPGVA